MSELPSDDELLDRAANLVQSSPRTLYEAVDIHIRSDVGLREHLKQSICQPLRARIAELETKQLGRFDPAKVKEEFDALKADIERLRKIEAAAKVLRFECKHSRAYERSDSLADALDAIEDALRDAQGGE